MAPQCHSSPRVAPVDQLEALAEVAKWVVADRPLKETLVRVAEIGCLVIEPCDTCSLTLVVTPHELTMGGTDEIAEQLDERQRQVGRGPCLNAAEGGEPVIVDDMETEDRWPDYTPRAVELGVRSSLSVPLPTQEHVVAALNWYSKKPRAFTQDHIGPAETFASQVAVAVTNAHLYNSVATTARQMQEAMATRAIIEQAKGILMAQSRVDADAAFNMLVRASQRENRKLREIASAIVERAVSGN